MDIKNFFYKIKKTIKKTGSFMLDFCKDPSKFVVDLNSHRQNKYAKFIPTRIFLKCYYKNRTGKTLHLCNPKELNEKIQWLKLYNRNPVYPLLADKSSAKKYVSNLIGEEHIIKTIGIWDSVEEINFDSLPDKFVLKCTHDSGSVIVCRDKKALNTEAVKNKLNDCLNRNYYWHSREWPYKNITPRIIAESYIENNDGSPLADFKFYCFGGEPKYFMYSIGEAEHHSRNRKFDMNCNSIDERFKKVSNLPLEEIRIPDNFNEMVSIVLKICKGFPHIRVDLYNINGKIYFGETTFFSNSGFLIIIDKKYANELAECIKLKRYNQKGTNNVFDNML